MDRRDADPDRALNQTFDLFIELGATEVQADFPVVYANGIEGRAGKGRELSPNLEPLFETILREIPAPDVDVDKPFQMLVANLGYDEYRGTTAVGRITAGTISEKQRVARMKLDGTMVFDHANYLYKYQGLEKIETDQAMAGDIICLAGLENIEIGETLADVDNPVALPPIIVEEPTVRMTFSVNTSPLTGEEGKWGTSRKLRERLFNELRNNVALRVAETDSAESFSVSGRGELHLAILIETMRREGYEFQVSRPEAIFIQGSDGEMLEPYEEVHVDTPSESVGVVVEMLGSRRGIMLNMINNPDNTVHITYRIPTRGLLGFRYQFLTATRGMGIMNTIFDGYDKIAQNIIGRSSGSLVARETGETTTFGLKNAEERGILFIACRCSCLRRHGDR